MENKPLVALFIPYKIVDGKILVYFQKRTRDAKRIPDLFGFFGGKVEEGEGVEEGLRREIKEELNFTLGAYEKLGLYESSKSAKHIFVSEVDENFEQKVTVLEGEYGKFLNEEEATNEPKILESYKQILQDLYRFVRKRGKV
ncbi:MAG: NUDIX domain-containing protein [Candidatus Brennerbacteria bacterium]